jgi:hypothetical protein
MQTITTLTLAGSLLAAAAHADIIQFDDATPGLAPPGWTATKTGSGNPNWVVVADDTAPSRPNVLKQSGEAIYPVALKDDTNLKDGFVEVKFKPVSGKRIKRAASFGGPRTRTTTTSPAPMPWRTT